MNVLTLNAGSSSIKYSVFDAQKKAVISRGLVERIGLQGSQLHHHQGKEAPIVQQKECPNHKTAIEWVLWALTHFSGVKKDDLQAVGHRVVHGGEAYAQSVLIDSRVEQAIEQAFCLAPLHNPPNLAGIQAARTLLPDVPQVAVFDTAFHQTLEPKAFLYPLPYEWYEEHKIRRYGFHGTSHRYVALRAAEKLGQPLEDLCLVTLHIGNGASGAAIQHGRSVDTTMGFTPLEGLVMGTRCGSIDPAILLYVMQHLGLSPKDLERKLNHQSGLLGITGKFADRRDIEKGAESLDPRCLLALEIEARTLTKTIGAYAAVMGGLDAIVFTAGVGENSPTLRQMALKPLAFMGIELDETQNLQAKGGSREIVISTTTSKITVLVIPTDEERVIAEDTLAIVSAR